MSTFEVPRLVKIVTACIGVGFLLGVALGKYLNRGWNNSDKTYLFIHNTMTFALADEGHAVLAASCGVDSFTYYSHADSLVVGSVSSGSLAKLGMRGGDIADITTIVTLLGIPTSGVTVAAVGKDVYKFMSEVSSGEKAIIAAAAILSLGSGVGVGLWLSYDAQPPYDNAVVKHTYNDKKTWRKLADSVRRVPRGVVLPKGIIIGKPLKVQ
jgi:hypothetical protein